LADWGNWAQAEKELTAVIDNNTRYSFSALTKFQARAWRAYTFAKQGRWQNALEEFEAVSRPLKDDALYHYLRGLSHYDREEKRAASKELSAALSAPCATSSLSPLKRESSKALVKELQPSGRVLQKRKSVG
jgi:tetratricopeptide (TPR) repeat protein